MLLTALTLTFSLLSSSVGATTLHLTEGEEDVTEGDRVLSLDEVRPAEAETAQTRTRRERALRRVERRLTNAAEGPERLALQLDQADLLLEQAMDPAALVEAPILLEQAVEIYKQVLKLAPGGARADEARFHLGRALNALGQEERANDELMRLIKSSPESPLVPESYLLLGEYYFKRHVYAKAMIVYKKASAYTESPYQSFALYRLAWCLNRLGEHAEAVSTMEAVVKRQPPPPLRAAAAQALLRFYADSGDLGPVYALLGHRPEEGARIVEDLVRRDLELGRFDEAIYKLRRLIAEAPYSPEAPRYQGQIVSAQQRAGRRMETLEEIDRYLKTYGPASGWARANAANPDAVAAALQEQERLLREGAIQYHLEVRKTGAQVEETSGIACQFYEVYLDTFPDSPHAAALRFGYGDLLYRLRRYDEAEPLLRQVIAHDVASKDAERAATLILAADRLRSDWERLRDDARAFYALPGLGGADFKQDALQAQRDAEAKLAAP